jgi:hypothetical protein
MQLDRRVWLVLALIVTGVIIALVGGASAGGATTACSTGRPFCVTITDLDGRSRSTAASPHYMKYEVSISRNGGTSNLTNGMMTLTLDDIIGGTIDSANGTVIGGTPQASNAVFQPSPASTSACKLGSASNILTCTVPNFPAGSQPLTYAPLIFETSTTTTANGTRLKADVSFKEKGSDSQPVDPNQDTLSVSETTTYEGDADLDVSWAYPNAAINLQTSTADAQYSTFPLAIPSTTDAFTAKLQETSAPAAFCPNCKGQIVSTVGGGIFSASKPAHVTIVWNFKPSGFTESGGTAYHKPDVGLVEVITQKCVFAPNTTTPTSLPCRTITIQNLSHGDVLVTTDVWASNNGGWGVG